MLIDDYIDYHYKFQKKYGDKTVILMQVGSFFEAYAIDNEEEKINVENLYHICDFMNIQISRKNKNIIKSSRSNPLMAGFPLLAIDKFIQILMNNKYTVVLIEQVTEPPEPERKVTNIFSPGTTLNYCPSEESSNLLSIYIETIKDLRNYKDTIFVGLSVIDIPTGKNIIYECNSEKDDINHAYDEIYRFIQTHNPREILINCKSCPLTKDKLISYLEIKNKIYHYYEAEEIDKSMFKLSYQRHFFEKIFKDYGLLSIHEYLDIEKKSFGAISYVSLLQFAYEHNESIINRIQKPVIWNSNKYLILTNDSINQLNVVDNNSSVNNKFSSLYGIVNNASTSLGKRYLKEKLLNPIINVEQLNKRYSLIEELLSKDEEGVYYYKIVEPYLNKIMDIERLHRRISLGILQPADFSGLDIAYTSIQDIFKLTHIFSGYLKQILPTNDNLILFDKFIEEYKNLFNLEEISKYHLNNINNSFFNEGQIEEIDEIQLKIGKYKTSLKDICSKLSYYIDRDNEVVRLEYNDREGHYLQTTKKRGETLKKSFANMGWKEIKAGNIKIDPKELELKFMKDKMKITSDKINNLSYKLRKTQEEIKSKTTKVYLEKLEYFWKQYGGTFQSISDFISKLDFYKSNAKTSILYGYNKPIIKEDEQSYIDVKDLRHPIIERIQTDTEYVPNDICIGKSGEISESGESCDMDKLNGMLLYGCNAVGKSSLMKAVGLNIIMAQAGMYVASSEFIFNPFNYIFTRISDNDNLFKGQSSFAVEMSELRAILKRSNKNSIILGDELCSGTESVSALSIFASSVIRLAKMECNFIFATHLHELYKIEEIKNLVNVDSFHLKVIFEENTKKLIYDRKLEKGNGPAIYGLEVCKAMDLDREFLKLANTLRKRIMDIDENIQGKKLSPYNKDIFLDKCEICGDKAVDTHHIKEQNTADENGIIGHIHKNSPHNLTTLCEKCHDNVHNGDLKIDGYQKTSDSVELKFEFISKEEYEKRKLSKKKYGESEINMIKSYRDKENMSMNKACILLEKNDNIKISRTTIKKIWEDKY